MSSADEQQQQQQPGLLWLPPRLLPARAAAAVSPAATAAAPHHTHNCCRSRPHPLLLEDTDKRAALAEDVLLDGRLDADGAQVRPPLPGLPAGRRDDLRGVSREQECGKKARGAGRATRVVVVATVIIVGTRSLEPRRPRPRAVGPATDLEDCELGVLAEDVAHEVAERLLAERPLGRPKHGHPRVWRRVFHHVWTMRCPIEQPPAQFGGAVGKPCGALASAGSSSRTCMPPIVAQQSTGALGIARGGAGSDSRRAAAATLPKPPSLPHSSRSLLAPRSAWAWSRSGGLGRCAWRQRHRWGRS